MIESAGFGIFDAEWARRVRRVGETAARLGRVQAEHPPHSLEYQAALFGYKQALQGVREIAKADG